MVYVTYKIFPETLAYILIWLPRELEGANRKLLNIQDIQVKNFEPQKANFHMEVTILIYVSSMNVNIGHYSVFQNATIRQV